MVKNQEAQIIYTRGIDRSSDPVPSDQTVSPRGTQNLQVSNILNIFYGYTSK